MRPLIRACQRFKTEIQAGSQIESGELLISKAVTDVNVRILENLYRFETRCVPAEPERRRLVGK